MSHCDVNSGCVNTPISCSDPFSCTFDSCSGGTCCHQAEDSLCPQPTDKCSSFHCDISNPNADPATGCVFSTVSCNDNIDCTIDSPCDPTLGCVFTPDDTACPTTNPCQVAICSTTVGCITEPVNCNDLNPCTIDTCSGGQCFHTPNHTICSDGLRCTDDVCLQETDSLGNLLPNSFRCAFNFNPLNCGTLPSCQTPLCGVNTDCTPVTHDNLCPSLVVNGVNITCLVPQCSLATGCGLRDTCAGGDPLCGTCIHCSCNTDRNSCFPTCASKRSLPLNQEENGGHVVSFTLLNLFVILCLIFINKL